MAITSAWNICIDMWVLLHSLADSFWETIGQLSWPCKTNAQLFILLSDDSGMNTAKFYCLTRNASSLGVCLSEISKKKFWCTDLKKNYTITVLSYRRAMLCLRLDHSSLWNIYYILIPSSYLFKRKSIFLEFLFVVILFNGARLWWKLNSFTADWLVDLLR